MLEDLKRKFFDQILSELENLAVILEKEPDGDKLDDTVERIFTISHQISGTAPMLGYEVMPKLSRKVERAFYEVRTNNRDISSQFLQQTRRTILSMIETLKDESKGMAQVSN
ncbi:Hpt domain-containing protein [Geofilum sp. OHC36d9]|uniref:Hpt domain-containing protein n=1 Tax=Geofilum sp. OHC36d9 TaxID=3458413 RepID=UPI004033B39B